MTRIFKVAWIAIITSMTFLVSCTPPNKTDLEKILSPAALPYLKSSKLIQVSSYDTTGRNNDKISIPAGKTATILNVKGPGVITRMWFTIDSNDPDYLRQVLIRIYWDGEDDPSVEVPIGDFFGCGFQYKPYATQYLSMTSGGFTCFFPMPFEDDARIEIENQTSEEIPGFYYQIDYQKIEGYLSTDIGYFHAYWHRDIRTDYDSNYTILKTEGKGHVVGVNLNIQSYDGGLTYLNGKERIFIDGEKLPSIQGTGTEDYFSGGWFFNKGEFAGPYNGLILKDDTLGRIAAYRFHILDPIPFKKSILFTIEHGKGNYEIADYSSTVYWYQIEPHKKMPPMLKPGLRIPLRVITPNKIMEAEKLRFTLNGINSRIMEMNDYGPEWSGSKQLLIESRNNESFSLDLQNLQDITYDLNIYFTKGPGYGNVGILYNGAKIGQIKGYYPKIMPGGRVNLKDIPISYNRMTLEFIIEGKDPASHGYSVGLDGIRLVPKRDFIPEWYIIGPFPAPKKHDRPFSGLDSIYLPEKTLDLMQVGFGVNRKPVTWKYFTTPDNGYISLENFVKPSRQVVCYAVTYIYSEEAKVVPLFIGSDEGIKVIFNKAQIYYYQGTRIAQPDQAELFLRVHKGWNQLLVKLEENYSSCGFYARLINKDHSLVISANQKLPNTLKK